MSKTYSLYLNSNDKIVGSNNNCQFNVIWDSFLPREYNNYEVSYTFQTTSGNYKNISFCEVDVNFGVSSYSYDTSVNAVSNILGYVYKDSLGCFNNSSNSKQIKCMQRPTQNIITVKVYNNNTTNLLVDTPYTLVFRGSITAFALTVSSTESPFIELQNNSVITGNLIPANTTVSSRTGAYGYIINNSVTVPGEPMLMTSGTVPTDMTAWTMIINFKPAV